MRGIVHYCSLPGWVYLTVMPPWVGVPHCYASQVGFIRGYTSQVGFIRGYASRVCVSHRYASRVCVSHRYASRDGLYAGVPLGMAYTQVCLSGWVIPAVVGYSQGGLFPLLEVIPRVGNLLVMSSNPGTESRVAQGRGFPVAKRREINSCGMLRNPR